MKNIVLIMLLCFVAMGCKSRQSRAHKSSLDSLTENREDRNLEIQAQSIRLQNTTLIQDSNWLNAVNLVNFSGIIYRDGTIAGSAENASVNQSGNKNSKQDSQTNEQGSATIKETAKAESKVQIKKKENDRHKEVKGIAVPWWVWMIPILALLIWLFAKRFKRLLKPF